MAEREEIIVGLCAPTILCAHKGCIRERRQVFTVVGTGVRIGVCNFDGHPEWARWQLDQDFPGTGYRITVEYILNEATLALLADTEIVDVDRDAPADKAA